MAYKYGRDASIKLGTTEIIQCRNWELNLSSDTLDVTVLGDDFKKTMPNINNWACTLEALFDPTDTNGQKALHDAYFDQTKITDLKLFLDGSAYYAPDTASEATAGCYVTAMKVNQVQSGLSVINFTVTGYGPIAYNAA